MEALLTAYASCYRRLCCSSGCLRRYTALDCLCLCHPLYSWLEGKAVAYHGVVIGTSSTYRRRISFFLSCSYLQGYTIHPPGPGVRDRHSTQLSHPKTLVCHHSWDEPLLNLSPGDFGPVLLNATWLKSVQSSLRHLLTDLQASRSAMESLTKYRNRNR